VSNAPNEVESNNLSVNKPDPTYLSSYATRPSNAQASPDTDPASLAVGAYHDTPLKGRRHTSHVFPVVGTCGSLEHNIIYTYHPSSRLDLQCPLALVATNTNTSPDFLNNHYITGTHSDDSTTDNAFSICIQLPNTRPHDNLHLLMLQLTEIHTQGHTTDPSSFPNIATVQSLTGPPYHAEFDDEPIHTNTLFIDPNIPYLHIVTLPIYS
jgi:hypothetical protein